MSKPKYKVGDKVIFNFSHYGIHNGVGEIMAINYDMCLSFSDYTIANNIPRCWDLFHPYKEYKYGLFVRESDIARKFPNKESIE